MLLRKMPLYTTLHFSLIYLPAFCLCCYFFTYLCISLFFSPLRYWRNCPTEKEQHTLDCSSKQPQRTSIWILGTKKSLLCCSVHLSLYEMHPDSSVKATKSHLVILVFLFAVSVWLYVFIMLFLRESQCKCLRQVKKNLWVYLLLWFSMGEI